MINKNKEIKREIEELKENISALNVILENTTRKGLVSSLHSTMVKYKERLKNLKQRKNGK